MPKPILIVRLPYATPEMLHVTSKRIEEKISDWHVITVWGSQKEVAFDTYTVDSSTDVDIEKLKEIINQSI
jgi:hypothetical protein